MLSWKIIKRVVLLVFPAICLLSATSDAGAHGGLSLEMDTCVLKFSGKDFKMHFSGYQPNSSKQEFCEDIPEPGRTIVAIDYIDRELRPMTAELRIIKDTGDSASEGENLDQITEVYLPPEKHPTGTFNFEHNFKEGKYVGIATVRDGEQPYVSRFPFSVGGVRSGGNLAYVLMPLALAVGGAAAGFWFMRRRGTTAS
jgi:hypothetical protein